MSFVRAVAPLHRLLGPCLVTLTALCGGPALAKEVYQRVVPPDHVLPGLQKVVIIKSGSGADRAFQQAISAKLRTRIGYDDAVPVADQGLRSDLIDAVTVDGSPTPGIEEIVTIAQKNGAQAVVVASASGGEVAYETYTEDRNAVVFENGQSREEHWTVSCARRDVTVSWSASLYDGRDGASVVQRSDSVSLSDRDCDEKGSDPLKIASVDDMINTSVVNAAVVFAVQWAPRWDRVKFAMPSDKAGREVSQLAEDGDWERVVSAAKAVLADDPYNAVAVYYIGLGLEVNGRAKDAAVAYDFANRLREDRVYARASSGARDRAKELDALASLSEQRPTRWDQPGLDALLQRAQGAAAVALAGQPAEIKGTGNKRAPVFDSPTGAGTVLVSIPGGTQVRRVKEDGDMVQIQLPDGQLGWVSSKLIR